MSEYTKCPNCGKTCLIDEMVICSEKVKCIYCIESPYTKSLEPKGL